MGEWVGGGGLMNVGGWVELGGCVGGWVYGKSEMVELIYFFL